MKGVKFIKTTECISVVDLYNAERFLYKVNIDLTFSFDAFPFQDGKHYANFSLHDSVSLNQSTHAHPNKFNPSLTGYLPSPFILPALVSRFPIYASS